MPSRIRGIRQGIPGGQLLGRVGNSTKRGAVGTITNLSVFQGIMAAAGASVAPQASSVGGQSAIADGDISSNIAGATGPPIGNTATAVLDYVFGNAQGNILYRGASAWVVLAPGTAGYFLKTQGSAANPVWAAAGVGTPAKSTKSVASPTGTTSTSQAMMGLAGSITPVVSGNVTITVTGDVTSSVLGNGATMQLYTGTSTAPMNGAAVTGTSRGSIKNFVDATATGRVPFTLCWLITGLTLSTAYWIDVALAAVTGGTATIYDVDIVAVEVF